LPQLRSLAASHEKKKREAVAARTLSLSTAGYARSFRQRRLESLPLHGRPDDVDGRGLAASTWPGVAAARQAWAHAQAARTRASLAMAGLCGGTTNMGARPGGEDRLKVSTFGVRMWSASLTA